MWSVLQPNPIAVRGTCTVDTQYIPGLDGYSARYTTVGKGNSRFDVCVNTQMVVTLRDIDIYQVRIVGICI